jgi:aspartate aminotransferase-like enzyme
MTPPAPRKLFIPGPVEVRRELREQMARPLIGHRSADMTELLNRIRPRLRTLMGTRHEVLVGTCSGSGLLEAAIRNLVQRRCLALTCGAFSERWQVVASEWGEPNLPKMLQKHLRNGGVEAVLVVHNESSTGLANPLEEIAEVMRSFPHVLFLVDAVTSVGGLALEVDPLGIDVAVASVQKALALPPGIAVASVSERAFERARQVPARGFYFDFLRMRSFAEKGQTPSTPSIPHLFALDQQLEDILAEGLAVRWKRHRALGDRCRAWALERFALFPRQGFESDTLTCVRNTRGIEIPELIRALADRGFVIANGYGKLKNQTFRIGHLGDVRESDLEELLEIMDEILEKL